MLQSASAFLTPALCRGRAERRPEHQASSSASASASAALTDCCFDGLRSCFAAPVQEASWCGHMPVPEPRGRLPPRHLRRRSSQRRQHGQAVRHVGHIQVLGRARQHVENVVLVELLLAALAAGGGPSPFLSALRCGRGLSSAVRVAAVRPRVLVMRCGWLRCGRETGQGSPISRFPSPGKPRIASQRLSRRSWCG